MKLQDHAGYLVKAVVNLRVVVFSVAALVQVLSSTASAQQQSADEQAAWTTEHTYWEYVKALDLENYKKMCHPNFVVWGPSSAKPDRGGHITDWITSNVEKGLHLDSYSLDPAAIQATENVVVVQYWLTVRWADKDGKGEPRTLKVTHTWIRTPRGLQIIDGMAAPASKPEKAGT